MGLPQNISTEIFHQIFPDTNKQQEGILTRLFRKIYNRFKDTSDCDINLNPEDIP